MNDWLESERNAAAEWARGVLADPGAVILDTETTGLRGELVEISIIDSQGEVVFDSLVRPLGPIPVEATVIHGIGDADVADALAWPMLYEQVGQILKQASRVVVYNLAFDSFILDNTCRMWNLEPLRFSGECAMEQYARWYGQWSDYHGSFRWQRLDGGHRALGDCRAALAYIKQMAEVE